MASQSLSVKLDPELRRRIEALAETRRRSAHWIMCEAIEQYIGREEQRDAFHQDALAAWEEYQETGLSISADAVAQWLESWGSETELAAPVIDK